MFNTLQNFFPTRLFLFCMSERIFLRHDYHIMKNVRAVTKVAKNLPLPTALANKREKAQ